MTVIDLSDPRAEGVLVEIAADQGRSLMDRACAALVLCCEGDAARETSYAEVADYLDEPITLVAAALAAAYDHALMADG